MKQAVEPLESRWLPAAGIAQASSLLADYLQTPLSFEANQGQTDPSVAFLSRGSGDGLFLSPMQAVLALPSRAFSEVTDNGDGTYSATIRSSAIIWKRFSGREKRMTTNNPDHT